MRVIQGKFKGCKPKLIDRETPRGADVVDLDVVAPGQPAKKAAATLTLKDERHASAELQLAPGTADGVGAS